MTTSCVAIATWDWPAFTGGGISSLMHTLAIGLVEVGADVVVWTRGGGERGAALRRTEHPAGVRVVAFPGRSWRARGHRHWGRGARRRLPLDRPDLVVASSWEVLPGLLSTGPACRVACFAHGRDITAALSPKRSAKRARVLEHASVTWLCLTSWMQEQLVSRGVDPERVVVVPAAVPGPNWGEGDRPPLSRSTQLLTVGRLIPRKGHDVLFDAWPRLLAQHPGVCWDIVGEGPERGSIEVRAGSHPGVRVHGFLEPDALEAMWRKADLLVLPCREESEGDTEGYGLVFLEAAARCVPVVGGGTAGAREAVAAVGGWVIEDPTSPEAVAGTLVAVLDGQDLTTRGRAAHAAWQARARPMHLASAVIGLQDVAEVA